MGQTQGRHKSHTKHATLGDDREPEATAARRRPPTTATAAAMDTFFLSHGSPTLSIDETLPARHFFQSWLPAAVAGPERPRAILMVSGHWETATPAVNVIRGSNDTIYDFYGFPKSMYKVRPSLPSLLLSSLAREGFRGGEFPGRPLVLVRFRCVHR
jgi:4,5-DOPA dioxygenase extradiol